MLRSKKQMKRFLKISYCTGTYLELFSAKDSIFCRELNHSTANTGSHESVLDSTNYRTHIVFISIFFFPLLELGNVIYLKTTN